MLTLKVSMQIEHAKDRSQRITQIQYFDFKEILIPRASEMCILFMNKTAASFVFKFNYILWSYLIP